jgi:hypothetical protein
VPAGQRDRAYQACQRRRRVNLKFLLAFFLVRSRLARDRVIVACEKEIDRLNIRAADTEDRRLRKVEAEARRIDLTQGSILENCRLPNLLIGQHGASQAWPLSQPNVGLQLLSSFPKNGSPGSEEDEFYELVTWHSLFAEGAFRSRNQSANAFSNASRASR